MKKELPKIFRGNVISNTNKSVAYISNEKKEDIESKINRLFRQNQIYKQDVSFETNSNKYDTKLIGRTKDHIITIDNSVIKISDITKFDIK